MHIVARVREPALLMESWCGHSSGKGTNDEHKRTINML